MSAFLCSILPRVRPLFRVIKVAQEFIGEEFIGEVYFAISDKDEYGSELQTLGLDVGADVVAGLYDTQGYKYAMTDKFR